MKNKRTTNFLQKVKAQLCMLVEKQGPDCGMLTRQIWAYIHQHC